MDKFEKLLNSVLTATKINENNTDLEKLVLEYLMQERAIIQQTYWHNGIYFVVFVIDDKIVYWNSNTVMDKPTEEQFESFKNYLEEII